MTEKYTDISVLIEAARTGDSDAVDRLFPLVYEELRSQARRNLAGMNRDGTMNTTAIVHEAYLKMSDQSKPDWNNRAHFFAIAAKAMRHVYLDYAKRKTRQKRGGGAAHVPIEDVPVADQNAVFDDAHAELVLELDAALKKLEEKSPRLTRVVECRFFGGMTVEDTSLALGISPATVKRDWTMARTLLFTDLKSPE
jgi:RNA polymerase sigma factor (TIGR02999 family)